MKPDRHRAGAWARGAFWTASLGLLALLLAAQAYRARIEAADVSRRRAVLDRDVDRMSRKNQALRDELRALETDPVYVESILRRRKMTGPSERLVD